MACIMEIVFDLCGGPQALIFCACCLPGACRLYSWQCIHHYFAASCVNSCSRMTGKSAFGQAVRQLLFKALAKYRRFGLEDGVRVRMWHSCVMEIFKARVSVFGFVVVGFTWLHGRIAF